MTTISQQATSGAISLGAHGETVRLIQRALLFSGAELAIDGDFGDNTEKSVARFQAAHNLSPLGFVGPKTAAALDGVLDANRDTKEPTPQPSTLVIAPWLSVMRAITGTKEIPGSRSNPLILSWVAAIGARYPDLKKNIGWYVNDDTPWCGLGMAYCLAEAGFKPPVAPLRALNWAEAWPDGYKLSGPALGAVCVFSRVGGGHVSTYEGEDANNWYIRGCNQSDAVNVSPRKKSHGIEAFMWPKGGPQPVLAPVKWTGKAVEGTKES